VKNSLPTLFSLVLLACGGTQDAEPSERLVTRPMAPLIDRTQSPAPGEARPYEIPDPRTFTLDNGLEVVVVERASFPTFAARLSVRAGTDTTDGRPALAGLTARLLRDGTADLDAAEIAQFIDANGIEYSASAGENRLVMSVDALADSAAPALTLLSQLATEAAFADDRFAARQGEMADEIEVGAARPEWHSQRMVRRVLFGDHTYGVTVVPDDVLALGVDDVRAFHDAAFDPRRARLVLVGDLPADIDALVQSAFGAWAPSDAALGPRELPANVEITTCNEAWVVVRPGSVQTTVAWVGPGIADSDERYFDALLANHVLGGGASARLFMNLRERRSLTYGAYSSLAVLDGASWFSASSNVRSEVTAEALDAFEEEFARFDGSAIPVDDLDDARDYLAGVFPIENETNAQLASRVSSVLDRGLGVDWLRTYRGQVRSVEPDRAGELGARLVDRDHLTLVMVGPEEAVVDVAAEHASRVVVYDLEGKVLREVEGQLTSSCGADSP
jgi:predicted Zn-dependent peptidase